MNSQAPFFIVGHPRSGTTLLRDLLRSHPNITIPYESHFIPSFYRGYGDPTSDHEARCLGAMLLKLYWFERWRVSMDSQEFTPDRTFGQVVSRMFHAWARQEQKPRWGDKTPQYVTEIPTIREIFPNAKFIHIIRDGRDVAMSWVKHPQGGSSIYTTADTWKRWVTVGRRDGAALPAGDYLELRYESLLAHPEETMRRVCDFLEEPFTEKVLTPNLMSKRAFPALIVRRWRAPVSTEEIAGWNVQKWKTRMSRRQRALFESIAGEVLDELGYETEGLARPLSSAERSCWNGHHLMMSTLLAMNLGKKWSWIPTHLRKRWADRRARIRLVAGSNHIELLAEQTDPLLESISPDQSVQRNREKRTQVQRQLNCQTHERW